MKVCKFDGTSVATVERMKQVAKLVSDDTPKIVVLSATAGITRHLEEISACLFNRDIEQAHDKITRLEFQFVDFANELLTEHSVKKAAVDYILECFQQIWKFTKNSFSIVEEKEVVAQGELISSALLNFYLHEQGTASTLLNASDFMRLDLDGEPNPEYIEKKMKEQLSRRPDTHIFITQGFISFS